MTYQYREPELATFAGGRERQDSSAAKYNRDRAGQRAQQDSVWLRHWRNPRSRRERKIRLPHDEIGAIDISIAVGVAGSSCRARGGWEIRLPSHEVRSIDVVVAVEITGSGRSHRQHAVGVMLRSVPTKSDAKRRQIYGLRRSGAASPIENVEGCSQRGRKAADARDAERSAERGCAANRQFIKARQRSEFDLQRTGRCLCVAAGDRERTGRRARRHASAVLHRADDRAMTGQRAGVIERMSQIEAVAADDFQRAGIVDERSLQMRACKSHRRQGARQFYGGSRRNR
jgi:hypothetical protein